ncbi:MAG: hypothetical protein FD123_1467 [Bacteroidetes bacterium]|nr:MAG: hypothetical protein FD123_1467 [Bacteroidota bacterium]
MGAGASKPFGIPLTREILPVILDSIAQGNLFAENPHSDFPPAVRREMEEDLLYFLYSLMPGLQNRWQEYENAAAEKKKEIQFPLITEILSLVDHLNVNNNVPFPVKDFRVQRENSYSAKDLNYYRRLLDRAIYETLKDQPYYTAEEKSKLDRFVGFVTQQISAANKTALITTNYDTKVEMEIYRQNIKDPRNVDFGFSWRHAEEDTGEVIYPTKETYLQILKLHGSLNWLKCDLCDHVYINPSGNIIHQSFRNETDTLNSCHCGNGPLKSLIVAPSFERDVRDSNLLHIWKSALEAIRNADRLIIIGYSLPPEDIAIKSLLVRAKNSSGKTLPKNDVIVVQHGESAKAQYELLFGKDRFTYLSGGLEQFLSSGLS